MPKLVQVPEINLKVLSLNVQYFAGAIDHEKDYMRDIPEDKVNNNIDQFVALAYEVNPDIICLQEADISSTRTHLINQPREIALRLAKKRDELPYNVEFGSCIDLDQKRWPTTAKIVRWAYEHENFQWLFKLANIEQNRLSKGPIKLHFGNAILSRFPIKNVKHEYYFKPSWRPLMNFNIVSRKDERKSILRCQIDYHPEIQEKIPLYIINTHFESHNVNNRSKQSKILYEQLSENDGDGPRDCELREKHLQDVYEQLHERSGAHKILTGDFNDEGDGTLDLLLNHPNMRCYEKMHSDRSQFATYPTWRDSPNAVFDAILASQFLEISSYEVLKEDKFKVSDHYAVLANIKINHDLVPESKIKQMINY